MNDKSRVLAFLHSLGIDAKVDDNGNIPIVAHENTNVGGYTGFEARFVFNPDGSFHSVRIWE